MPSQFTVERRVEFSETDLAGLVHFSNFFRYMETAEHAFFRSLGYSIVTDQVEPPVGWPRVNAHCDYFKPVRFEDVLEVRLLVKRKGSRSLTYVFRMFNNDTREEVARGGVTAVCVSKDADGRMSATRIPAEIADRIEEAPPEAFE